MNTALPSIAQLSVTPCGSVGETDGPPDVPLVIGVQVPVVPVPVNT